MDDFIGEEVVTDLDGTPFEGFGAIEWALAFNSTFSGIDGEHHKTWVFDQMARVLLGTPVVVYLARWRGHSPEYRFRTGDTTVKYHQWVSWQTRCGEAWDTGIAP